MPLTVTGRDLSLELGFDQEVHQRNNNAAAELSAHIVVGVDREDQCAVVMDMVADLVGLAAAGIEVAAVRELDQVKIAVVLGDSHWAYSHYVFGNRPVVDAEEAAAASHPAFLAAANSSSVFDSGSSAGEEPRMNS